MAKKALVEGKKLDIRSVVSEISKKFRTFDAAVVSSDAAERQRPPYYISTGAPDFDAKLGGGFPGGRLVEVYSEDEGSGKSALMATAARENQKQGGVTIYFDLERTVDPDFFAGLGLDIGPDSNVIFSWALTLEDVYAVLVEFSEKLEGFDVPILFVLDSVAAAMSSAEYEKSDPSKPAVGGQARAFSAVLRQGIQMLAKHKATLICVNQARTNIGVRYGNPYTTPGGKALKFYSSQRIVLKRIGKLHTDGEVFGKDDAGKLPAGVRIRADIVKNKLAAPFRRTEYDLYFDGGVDYASSAWELLVRRGVLVPITAGGRYYKHATRGGKMTAKDMRVALEASEALRNDVLAESIKADAGDPSEEAVIVKKTHDLAHILDEEDAEDVG